MQDLADDNAPHAVLTGDALFIGDVGQPVSSRRSASLPRRGGHAYELLSRPDTALQLKARVSAHDVRLMWGKNLPQGQFPPSASRRSSAGVTADGPESSRYRHAEQPGAGSSSWRRLGGTNGRPFSTDDGRAPLKCGSARWTSSMDSSHRCADPRCRDAIDFEGAHLVGAINVGIQGKYGTRTVLTSTYSHRVIASGGEEEALMRRVDRIRWTVTVVSARIARPVDDVRSGGARRPAPYAGLTSSFENRRRTHAPTLSMSGASRNGVAAASTEVSISS